MLMTKNWRVTVLLIGLFAPLAVLLAWPPIAQDVRYHAYADTRAFFGIPHALNVASNVAFLVMGALGLAGARQRRPLGAATSWSVFFAGIALVAFGSAWYHLSPSNSSLVWDRLPMTLAFMALIAALVSEHLSDRLERVVLPAAIAVGVISIAWWHYADDLRLYVWVQFGPLLAIVLLLTAFPARYSHRSYLAWGLAFYVLAKVSEHADRAIFAYTDGVISGHTLKHLVAAVAPFCVYLMLRERKPIAA
jgi:Ceramidase